MKYLKIKLPQFKQWILSVIRVNLVFQKEIKQIKELELELINANNIDVKRIEGMVIGLLGCEKDIKNPLTVLYITKYSALSVDEILELNEFIDMNDPSIINVAMSMANKGYSNKLIIDACKIIEV